VANATIQVAISMCMFACDLVLCSSAFFLCCLLRCQAPHVEKAFVSGRVLSGNEWRNLWTHRLQRSKQRRLRLVMSFPNGAVGSRGVEPLTATYRQIRNNLRAAVLIQALPVFLPHAFLAATSADSRRP